MQVYSPLGKQDLDSSTIHIFLWRCPLSIYSWKNITPSVLIGKLMKEELLLPNWKIYEGLRVIIGNGDWKEIS